MRRGNLINLIYEIAASAVGLLAMTIFLSSLLHAKARKPEPGKTEDVYSITQAKPVAIASKKTKLPLVIYGEEAGSPATYVPSGFMGDAKSLKIKAADFSAPLTSSKTGTTCLRVQVIPTGREGWAGLIWQTPANNWGKIKGAGYDLSQAKTLTFWARGEKGGERVGEFKIGGLIGPYPDTDSLSMGPLRLTKEWTPYTFDLTDKDLRHIVGGFGISVRRSDNPRGAVFYIDEIVFKGETTEIPVAEAPPAAPPPPVPDLAKAVKIVIPFGNANVTFSPESRNAMNEIVAVALHYPEAKIFVEGHTDNIGSEDLNKKLSLQRAKAVADYLESKGIRPDRMTIIGYGEERPLHETSNSTPEGRIANRRVEVSLVP